MSGELGSGARTPVRGDLCPKCEYGTLDKVSYCNGHGYQQPGVLPGQSRGQCIHRHQGDHLLIQCLTCGFGIVEPCHDDPVFSSDGKGRRGQAR